MSTAAEDIEAIFTRLTTCLLNAEPLEIALPNRSSTALESTTRFNPLTQFIEPIPVPGLSPPDNRGEKNGGRPSTIKSVRLPAAPASTNGRLRYKRSRVEAGDEDEHGAINESTEDGVNGGGLPGPTRRATTAASVKAANASARDFAVTLRTLSLIHENLTSANHSTSTVNSGNDFTNGRVSQGAIQPTSSSAAATQPKITKREMFYRDPKLFNTQSVLDKAVDDVAAMMGRSRTELGIEAAGRGLVAGDVSWSSHEGDSSHYSADEIRIVPSEGTTLVVGPAVQWVLVVEKEATFRLLAQDGKLKAMLKHGIMITGKGYPPLSVRSFLRSIADMKAEVPILGLVDFDPHGLDILLTYKYGSASQAHVNARLAVPRLEWLGLRSGDVDMAETGLIPLTLRDRSKAAKLLGRSCLEELKDWKAELRFMLVAGVKAEIQVMAAQARGGNRGIEDWLFQRLEDL